MCYNGALDPENFEFFKYRHWSSVNKIFHLGALARKNFIGLAPDGFQSVGIF